jgi:uncharacterized protein YndB with AHSA1/START domain
MDVTVETVIAAPPAAVARVMFDAANDPAWIGGVRAVEAPSAPVAPGLRVRRHGGFLGRKFSWVTEVAGFEPDRRLDMAFVEGPFTGGVAYAVEADPAGSRVSVRNRATAKVELPGMAWMVRASVAADLKRLKALVEAAA